MKQSTRHELELESIAHEILKLATRYNSHIAMSKCHQEWMSDALLRLEAKGKVVRREVTIHYGKDADGVEASVNYIGFFLK